MCFKTPGDPRRYFILGRFAGNDVLLRSIHAGFQAFLLHNAHEISAKQFKSR
jgi:hypothetical protein